jgi:hypothetical protein
MTAMLSSEIGIDRDRPTTTSSTPSTTAATGIINAFGRPRKAIRSVASTAPRPDAPIRNPYPVAPLPRSSRASGGRSTWKFRPAIETAATSQMATMTSRWRSA